jgi:hypothetical protein
MKLSRFIAIAVTVTALLSGLLVEMATAATFNVKASRLAQNFYSLTGTNTILQTRFCFEIAILENAILTMNRNIGFGDGSIAFNSGTSCTVDGAYAPMVLAPGSYNATLTVEELPFFSDKTQNIIVRGMLDCIQYQYGATTLLLTFGNPAYLGGASIGTISFPNGSSCNLEGIYGLTSLVSGGLTDTSLPVPSGVYANTVSSSEIDVLWLPTTGSSTVSSYKTTVHCLTNGVTLDFTRTFPITPTSIQHTGLSAGATCRYQISACSSTGTCSSPSQPVYAKTFPSGVTAWKPEDGLWAIDSENTGQSGRGFQVEQRNGTLVFTYYGYASSGSGVWGLSAGSMNGSSYSGALTQYRGGTALGGTYSPATSSGSLGTVSMTFTSETAGTITLPGESAKAISKFNFSGTSSPVVVPMDGLWVVDVENNGQSGRGFQIEQHSGLMVVTYYGYQTDGTGLWTLAAGNLVGSHFTGDMYQYQGGTSLGGSYKPATSSGAVGAVTIDFTSPTTGAITFPGEAAKSISKFVW